MTEPEQNPAPHQAFTVVTRTTIKLSNEAVQEAILAYLGSLPRADVPLPAPGSLACTAMADGGMLVEYMPHQAPPRRKREREPWVPPEKPLQFVVWSAERLALVREHCKGFGGPRAPLITAINALPGPPISFRGLDRMITRIRYDGRRVIPGAASYLADMVTEMATEMEAVTLDFDAKTGTADDRLPGAAEEWGMALDVVSNRPIDADRINDLLDEALREARAQPERHIEEVVAPILERVKECVVLEGPVACPEPELMDPAPDHIADTSKMVEPPPGFTEQPDPEPLRAQPAPMPAPGRKLFTWTRERDDALIGLRAAGWRFCQEMVDEINKLPADLAVASVPAAATRENTLRRAGRTPPRGIIYPPPPPAARPTPRPVARPAPRPGSKPAAYPPAKNPAYQPVFVPREPEARQAPAAPVLPAKPDVMALTRPSPPPVVQDTFDERDHEFVTMSRAEAVAWADGERMIAAGCKFDLVKVNKKRVKMGLPLISVGPK